jgi:hypothetical protein
MAGLDESRQPFGRADMPGKQRITERCTHEVTALGGANSRSHDGATVRAQLCYLRLNSFTQFSLRAVTSGLAKRRDLFRYRYKQVQGVGSRFHGGARRAALRSHQEQNNSGHSSTEKSQKNRYRKAIVVLY